jgi:Ni/Fe-hydrogenase subunit HybB-like protein
MSTRALSLARPRPPLVQFFLDGLHEVTQGSRAYHVWMAVLTFLMCCGAWAYSLQLREGLGVTGMHDHVSWGLYISNFTFLVGVAAAAVILVMPTYVLKDYDFARAVLFGEAMAVAALVMAIAFVVVDVGGPARLWHLIPVIGIFNWPSSMLAWDILVLNGYLAINLLIPFYILYSHYRGRRPVKKYYVPAVFFSIIWAVSLHLVTAFLYAGLPARPFWNTALMGPRFLATAFTAGPALMIIILALLDKYTDLKIEGITLHKLSLVVTIAAQVCIIMLISEIFTELYRTTHHGLSAVYLFFGLHGKNSLAPWIWTSIAMTVTATAVLSVHSLRRQPKYLYPACGVLFVAILIEKGLGTIIPGFIPEPWGKVDEYMPTWVELMVTLGVWAMGAFVFTVLAKAAIPIEVGRLRYERHLAAVTAEAGAPTTPILRNTQ